MFNRKSKEKNQFMLSGRFQKNGYDWWWHSFTGINEVTKEERSFFIEYFMINPGLSNTVVLGKNGKNKPSYLMIKAGSWQNDKRQLHRFIDLKDVEMDHNDLFYLKGEDFYLSNDHITGNIDLQEVNEDMMCNTGCMSWDLHIEKVIPYDVGYGTSWLFRKLKAFEMYWHVSGMKSLYKGYVIYQGEKYLIDPLTCYGYADKNWGSNFTSPWVWLSSNDIVSNITHQRLSNTVFDFGGGRPKILGIPLDRKLLGGLYLEGKEYEYNFSKFWMLPKTTFHCEETDDSILWHVLFENYNSKCVIEVSCLKEDMLLVKYESPDGLRRHDRLWNGGNGIGNIKLYQKTKGKYELIEDLDIQHIGCEYGEYHS